MSSEIVGGEIEQHPQPQVINIEDDDDEIEQHLLARIRHAIDHLGDKQLPAQNEIKSADFIELVTMLQNKVPNQQLTPKVKPEHWSSVRRENLYSLNNLLSDLQITKNQSSFSSKILVQNSTEDIKKSLKKMKKELKGDPSETDPELAEMSVSHHQEPSQPLFPKRNKDEVYRWSSRHKPRNVYGFEHMVMAMERELVLHELDAPFKVYGVVGVAGIGKTTLCQDIFNRDSFKKQFCPRIWVCLSNQPNGRKNYNEEIVVRILKCLGMEDEIIGVENENDPNSLKRLILLLRLQLVGKKFLLVLDDAWKDDPFFWNLHQKEQPDKWSEKLQLAYGLPKGCGGTIVSSSRSDELLKKMLGYNVSLQQIKPHTKENIGEIFKEAVKGYDEDEKVIGEHLQDEKMYNAIIKKCDGIPLAAKLLAKIAREKLSPPKAETVPPPAAGAGRHEIKPAGVAAGSR